jgi:SagB-type dehydrogenase family enzyme
MDTVIRLRPDAALIENGAGRTLTFPDGEAELRDLSAGLRAVLDALGTHGDVDETTLGAQVLGLDGPAGLARWQHLRKRLDAGGLLERAVRDGEHTVARLRVLGRGPVTVPTTLPARVRLSRHATVRVEDGGLLVAAPTSHCAVELYDAALLGGLADWASSTENTAVLQLFAAAGTLISEPEDATQERAQWRSHDLWLHSRIRNSQLGPSYGGTYPLRDRFAPLPVTPTPRTGERVALTTPDLAVVAKDDPPLTEVIEQRHSVREHDDAAPITVEQLGELLYRTARTRMTFDGSDGQVLADRPYPCGGAVHELELYPLVTSCAGLEPGLWHYDGHGHALERVAEASPATRTLVEQAKSASLMPTDPQVLLIVAARFGRIMWKYDTIAYSLTLKHVGVLYQTIYLVATAMGLAVCGLGGGNAATFAVASGLDFHSEGSVGELVIGSRPAVVRSWART